MAHTAEIIPVGPEILLGNIAAYRDALAHRDAQRLHDLLKEGREAKATAGGN